MRKPEHHLIEIVDRQRKVAVPKTGLREFAKKALALIPEGSGLSATVAFVSDSRIRALNSEFRGKDAATDVLSFPFGDDGFGDAEHFGDIVISAETAARQAEENGLTLDLELKQLILHGFLHLAGHDHETDGGEMDRLEIALRKKLGIDA